MKYNIVKILKRFAPLLLCAFALKAPAQVSPYNNYVLTNLPPTLSSNVVSYCTNIVALTRNCALSIAGRTACGTSTGSELVYGSFSNDGTNFGLAPFVLTAAGSTIIPVSPTNNISVWTNFSQTYLSGFTAVNFYLVTNTSASTFTNLGWVVNRPTLNTATY